MPVQLIVGELDRRFTAIAGEMAESLRDGRIAQIASAGHAAHVERPEAFAATVLGFLDRIHHDTAAAPPRAARTAEQHDGSTA